MKVFFIRFFAAIGALNAIGIPLLFSIDPNQQPLFPLPGLYFIEIALVGVIGAFSLFLGRWSIAPWLASGILLAFVVLGGFSIGFFLIPAFLAFAVGGALQAGPSAPGLIRGSGLLLVGALGQTALILALVQIIH